MVLLQFQILINKVVLYQRQQYIFEPALYLFSFTQLKRFIIINQSAIILMTFFGQEKKVLNQQLKHSHSLGPGTYSPEKPLSQSKSYAPFGSLHKKQSAVKSNAKQPIGPGSYNINRDIIKPSVVQYENQNCIIIKINEQGNSQFKSKIERFGQPPTADTPGPGAYSQSENNKPVQRRRTKSVGTSFNKMKQLYTNQYKQKRKPTLVSDKPDVPEQEHEKKKENSKGVVRWDLNKKQRFHSEPKQYFNEEDKSILLDKVNIERKKSRQGHKQSSFFASKSIKSCFDQLVYKSSNPFKVEIRKMLGFQDQAPGPGSYQNQSSFKLESKAQKFQFFGSTVDRFEKNETAQITVGPGDYNINQSKQSHSVKRPNRIKSLKRKTITEPDEQISIGPGSYKIESHSSSKPSFNLKYNRGVAEFGSNKPRFQLTKEIKEQIKSEYISFMAQEDEERKKKIQEQFNMRRNVLKNKQYSVFASSSKRDCFQEKQCISKNPFGVYEVGVDDIGTRIKKKQELIQQFAECNLTKPGFLSAVQRFKTQKQQQPTHKDCWCQIKEVQKKNISHMSPSFQSNCLRTQVFENKNRGPAVGQYSKNSSFIKQSFNSRFIKENTNKTKKIKIWKTQK